MTASIRTMKPASSSTVSNQGRLDAALVPTSATASTSQAATSMIPAAVVAIVPARVPASPRSLTIDASTGSAVTDTATPMKSTKDRPVCDSPIDRNACRSATATPEPSAKGTSRAPAATSGAARPRPRNGRKSIS